MSDSLWPHESQHARPPCPSSTPGVHSDSCPSSQWYHPAISSSTIPFSSCPQSLPASESFPMSQLFAWGGQSTGVSALLVSGTEIMFDFIHESRPGYHNSCFCLRLSNMDWIYPLTWNTRKKADKIHEKVVFKILDIRPEGQWSLREVNKPSESYSCPQLTVWRVSGLLHRKEKSRYCQGSFWVEEMEKGT